MKRTVCIKCGNIPGLLSCARGNCYYCGGRLEKKDVDAEKTGVKPVCVDPVVKLPCKGECTNTTYPCMATCPHRNNVLCGRDDDHEGPHVACANDKHGIEVWRQT